MFISFHAMNVYMFLGVTALPKRKIWILSFWVNYCLNMQIHILPSSSYIICSHVQQERIPPWMPALSSDGSPSNNYCIPDCGSANSQHLQCNQPFHLFGRNQASWEQAKWWRVCFIFMKAYLAAAKRSEIVKFVKQKAYFSHLIDLKFKQFVKYC